MDTLRQSLASWTTAVRYDVEPLFVLKNRHDAYDVIRRDFNSIHSLGFEHVVFYYVDDDDRSDLQNIAKETGLIPIWAERWTDPVIQTKMRPRSTAKDDYPGPSSDDIRPKYSQHQAGWLNQYAIKRKPLRSAAIIEICKTESDPQSSVPAQLLSQYHRGLLAGRTGGIVVDRFRRIAGDSPCLIRMDGPLTPTQRTALQELIRRVHVWGPRLKGMNFRVLPTVEHEGDIRAVLFDRARRRYIFLVNILTDRYVRGRIVFSKEAIDEMPSRAVEVPPLEGRSPGRIILTRSGRLYLPIELRPGDAALFELF